MGTSGAYVMTVRSPAHLGKKGRRWYGGPDHAVRPQGASGHACYSGEWATRAGNLLISPSDPLLLLLRIIAVLVSIRRIVDWRSSRGNQRIVAGRMQGRTA